MFKSKLYKKKLIPNIQDIVQIMKRKFEQQLSKNKTLPCLKRNSQQNYQHNENKQNIVDNRQQRLKNVKNVRNNSVQSLKTARILNKKRPSSNNKPIIQIQHYLQKTNLKTNQNTTTKHTKTKNSQQQKSHSKLLTIPILQNSLILTQLNYPFNKISTIPKQFSKFYTNIISLNLMNNLISQILPLCYLQKLEYLILSHNIVSQIPKQIKKLRRLQVLDVSFNKLWYLNQIVALKQLILVRHQQMGGCIEIFLEGNSVVKANQKAVWKIISLGQKKSQKMLQAEQCQSKDNKSNQKSDRMNHHQQNIQKKDQSKLKRNDSKKEIKISSDQQTDQIRKNNLGNKLNIFKNSASQTNFETNNKRKLSQQNQLQPVKGQPISQKLNKQKSLNQSLLDISAIIVNFPVNHPQNNLKNLKVDKISKGGLDQSYNNKQQTKNNKIVNNFNIFSQNDQFKMLVQQKQQQNMTNNKSQTLLFESPYVSQSKTIEFRPLKPIQYSQEPKLNIAHFFQKVDNFHELYIQPAYQFNQYFLELLKRLNLIESLKQIPPTFKQQFTRINQQFKQKINLSLNILIPFLQYHQKNVTKFQNFNFITQCQGNLKIFKGLELKTNSFHQNLTKNYINTNMIMQIKWYEIWLDVWKKNNEKFTNLQCLINSFIILCKKIQKVTNISNIFYENREIHNKKQQKQHNPNDFKFCSSKKHSSRKQLKFLLFSQHKSSSKQNELLTQKQSKSLNKQNSQQLSISKPLINHHAQQHYFCMQCILKDQQIIQINQKINEQSKLKQDLLNKIQILKEQSIQMRKKLMINQKILQQQTLIINELQGIKPSTYQNIMLEQARSIQFMIQNNCRNGLDYYSNEGKQIINKSHYQIQQGLINNHTQFKTNFIHDINQSDTKRSSTHHNNQKPFNQNTSKYLQNLKLHQSHQTKTIQKSQQTYFKSNKIISLTNANTIHSKQSIQIQNKQKIKNYIIKNIYRDKQNHGYQVSMFGQEPKQGKNGNLMKQNIMVRQKYNMFEKINLENCHDNQDFYMNKNRKNIKSKSVGNYNNKNSNDIKMIKMLQNLNFNQEQLQNRITQIKNTGPLKIDNGDVLSQNNTRTHYKTQQSQQRQLLQQKQLLPVGYDYQNISISETQNYKHYIRRYLRNNIIQTLLTKKQQIQLQRIKKNYTNKQKNIFFNQRFQQQRKVVSVGNIDERNAIKKYQRILGQNKRSKEKYIFKKMGY